MGDAHDIKLGKLGNGFWVAFDILEVAMMDLEAVETSGRVSTGIRYFWMSMDGYADDSLYLLSRRLSSWQMSQGLYGVNSTQVRLTLCIARLGRICLHK